MAGTELFARVAFNLPLEKVFTYRVEAGIKPCPAIGKRVLARFRGRPTGGYLVGLEKEAPELGREVEIQPLLGVVDEEPLFGPDDLRFYERAAAYYQTPLGEALHSLLPGGLDYRRERLLRPGPKARAGGVTRSLPLGEILQRLAAGPLTLAELSAGLAPGPERNRFRARVSAWVRAGWLEQEERLRPPAVAAQYDTIYEITGREAILQALAASRIGREKRRRLEVFIAAGGFFGRRRFLREFAGGGRWLERWSAAGWLAPSRVPRLRYLDEHQAEPAKELPAAVVLTPAQEEIFATVEEALASGDKFSPFLLHGVTGSGKTEIYIKLIARTLERGRSALYLVPEIALTIALVDRLVHEFGPRIALLHSGLSPGERYDQWRRIAAGRAPIVVGARSAVFAPLPAPGLIIVDEEHEPSFKQENSIFPYHGRDLALLRGQLVGCGVVLGSATPDLKSFYNAATGRYRLLTLPDRLDEKEMPRVEIVDLAAGGKPERMFAWDGFSPELQQGMERVLAAGRQVMLFLNQRGFSRTLYCLKCGAMPECRLCSVHPTFHKDLEQLVCHYCGGRQPVPEVCPQCGGSRFFPLGLGIQKLEEGLAHHFPAARVLRLDRDATRRRGELARILETFRRGEAEILLGTQMLAKGHNFPGVDLVGVIFADLSLEMPEFTAPERTFQLLAQVAGRTGRDRDRGPGEVIIQTLQPDHYSITAAAAHDYETFYARELENRRELGFPPFSYLANLRATGPDQERVREFLSAARHRGLELLAASGAGPSRLALLGPVPNAIVRIRDRYRWNLLVKAAERPFLHTFLRRWRAGFGRDPRVGWRLDIDPISFF
jgi:primosomal protein N' (replication factor Y)